MELKKSAVRSKGNYNKHGLGGAQELVTKYGIAKHADIVALQKIFGVSRLGEDPPLTRFLEIKCKIPGKSIALRALN